MPNTPSPPELPVVNLNLSQGDGGQADHVRRNEIWQAVLRNWVLIGACVLVCFAAAVIFVLRSTPVYEASSSLRIENKAPDLPGGLFKDLSRGSDVITEMQVLRSRTLAEDATALLGLQVRLVKPDNVSRETVLTGLQVQRNATPAEYGLVRQPDGRFVLLDRSTKAQISVVKPGDSVSVGGITFALTPAAADFDQLVLQVSPFDAAVASVNGATEVDETARDANIVEIRFRDPDPQLARQVPNVIAARFLARRQDAQKAEARSTVKFLRGQLDTLSEQLKNAENELRRFQERERVVRPEVEAQGQVNRLISLQSDRTTLEAERAALAKILDEIRASAGKNHEDAASSYRRLMAFPTLLRDGAASQLLSSLTEVEAKRTELRALSTENDPDVQTLSRRARDIENQLQQFAATYLQGLTNQIASLDAGLNQFSQQLATVPRRELEFARLERKPKVLEDIYTLLQSRMKEAEIAAAVEDPSIQIVDAAITPAGPTSSNRYAYLLGSIIAGLLLGISAAFTREYLDSRIRTRRDVRVVTGLPVVGLIPRLASRHKHLAMIAEKQKTPVRKGQRSLRPSSSSAEGRAAVGYTFLSGIDGLGTAAKSDEFSAQGQIAGSVDSTRPPPRGEIRFTLLPPGTAPSEAYGSLQTNVAFSRRDTEVKTIIFTSPLPGDGKTTTSFNFALAAAQRGLRVLLVDADVRRGVVHKFLEVPQNPGLTEVLSGAVSLEQACRRVMVGERATLHVLPTGKLPASPSGMLESPEMRAFLERTRNDYDLVVFDSPPVNILTDAALLGAQADGVLIVVRSGVTDAAALVYAAEQLGHVGAPVLGVVLNAIDFRKDARYDAAYRYYNYEPYRTTSSS